jgi:hypothetical protein
MTRMKIERELYDLLLAEGRTDLEASYFLVKPDNNETSAPVEVPPAVIVPQAKAKKPSAPTRYPCDKIGLIPGWEALVPTLSTEHEHVLDTMMPWLKSDHLYESKQYTAMVTKNNDIDLHDKSISSHIGQLFKKGILRKVTSLPLKAPTLVQDLFDPSKAAVA